MNDFTPANGRAALQILLLSPYHSGSHQAWAEGYQAASQHSVQILSLPGQLWKWRMHGAAVTLARQFLASELQPDVIVADDMLDLATFLALTRRRTAHLPVMLYMHENQLTYPLPNDKTTGPMRRNMGVRERQYVLLNWKAMLAADQIFFNSQHHLTEWFNALPNFLKHYRDYKELKTIPQLQEKSRVVPVGINLQRVSDDVVRPLNLDEPPLIIWNQRWEFDKNPERFFEALYMMKAEKRPFRLALCGESFKQRPELFLEAQNRLADEIIHSGYADSAVYTLLLKQAEITISTAFHEFFGISILEALAATTFPILPHRLSYPELIPAEFYPRCLYTHFDNLLTTLRWALTHRPEAQNLAVSLASHVMQYDWSYQAPQYDQLLAEIA